MFIEKIDVMKSTTKLFLFTNSLTIKGKVGIIFIGCLMQISQCPLAAHSGNYNNGSNCILATVGLNKHVVVL